MELLECFQNLQELNLSDNDIRELPNDMAGLKNVAILNLNGNEFNDVSSFESNNDLYIVWNGSSITLHIASTLISFLESTQWRLSWLDLKISA